MSHISTSYISDKHKTEEHDEKRLFTIPFAEYDLLELQAIFVKTGIHTIKTKNVHDGRKIVTTILDSLNYYHNIACITEEQNSPFIAYDVISHIYMQRYQKEDLLISLEEFFLSYPCFDFILVEFSKNIKNNYSLQDLKKFFNMFHVQERMPVLIIQYEDKS